jgi:glycosyltransferase involved in cell wall biosynthesis
MSWLWGRESSKLAKCESAFVRTFSHTLLCTEAEAGLLHSMASTGSIGVLENSLDTDYYRPEAIAVSEEIKRLQPYAIFTGTMDYFPNIDAVQFFCREVLPHLRARVPNLRFVIAGRNPSREVMRLAAEPEVVVTGAVPDIRPYLKGAAVAVAPMRIARGVQTKILEALAMDVPVVASSIAAAALPRELASLLKAQSDPRRLAACVADSVLNPVARSGSRHASIKRYIGSLDLASRLEQVLETATNIGASAAREVQLEVAV